MITEDMVVEAARVYTGHEWKHQARGLGTLDCVGLLIKVAQDLGIDHGFKLENYSRNPDGGEDGGTLARVLRNELVRVYGPLQRASVILYRSTHEAPRHVSIVTELKPTYIIHADSSVGKVVEVPAPAYVDGMHACGVYRYKELT